MILHAIEFIKKFFGKKSGLGQSTIDDFVVYNIIKSSEDGLTHLLQCSNTRNTFNKEIKEIIYDNEILFGLPPLQSCGLGIQFAKILVSKKERISIEKHLKPNLKHQSMHRYGKYCLHFQDRNGKIFFVDTCTDEGFFMGPTEIALSKDLISQFDASQSFYIGFSAGITMRSSEVGSNQTIKENKLPTYLRVIK